MAVKNGKFISQYKIVIKNTAPLNISDGDGKPLINEETNEAFIPGTSTAGAFRAYLSRSLDDKLINILFGENSLSKLFIYDSFAKIKGYEIRPSVRINSFTGAAEDKGKFDRYLISEGHEFILNAELYAESKEELHCYEDYFETCISALDNGDIQLGSFKSIGTGIFKTLSINKREFDLTNKKGMFKYLNNINSEIGFNEIKIKKYIDDSNIVTYELKGKLKTPLLIGGYSSLDYKRADNEQMTDAYGNPIIPGSSLKGVIRAEMDKIYRIFCKDDYTEIVFGTSADEKDIRKSSKLVVMNSKIENSKKQAYNRIKVDKFTGGVRKSALMTEEPVVGDITICAKYRIQNDEKLDGCTIAALATVFRDIAIGNIPIGGGNNIGRGRVEGTSLKIFKNSEQIYDRDYNEKDAKCDKLGEYFKVLNEMGCN